MTDRRQVTRFSLGDEAHLCLDGALIGRGVKLALGDGARVSIARGSYVTDGTLLAAASSIEIGPNCAISWGVTIIDDDGHGAPGHVRAAPISIGPHVWIGCHAIILKGVSVGEGSVLGAGAVVTKSCPPRSLLVGNPARVVRENVAW